MLPCVIAEGGPAFFISSTSTGAASGIMSRIFQNRKMRDRKIKTVSGGSLFFRLAKNIHETAPKSENIFVD
jgi:hypothetical protein